MSLTHFPHGVSSFGMPVIGSGGGQVPVTTGSYFFVNSVTGSDSYTGENQDSPLATIDAAINKCTANKGDVIIVMPGHAETIADATSLVPDVDGITIVGLGNGFDRPELTFSATDSEIIVTGENTVLRNLIFKAGISAVATAVDVDANYVTIDSCLFYYGGTTGYDFVIGVDIDAYDYTEVKNCEMYAEAATAGAEKGIRIDDANGLTIENNWLHGDFADAPIANVGADALGIGLLIKDNLIYNDDTVNTAGSIELANACTGLIVGNKCGHLNATTAVDSIDPGSCLCIENYVCNSIDESGTIVPSTLSDAA